MDYLKLLAYTAGFLFTLGLLLALAFYENRREP